MDTDLVLWKGLLFEASNMISLLEELWPWAWMWLLNEEIVSTDCISNVHLIVIGNSRRERALSFLMLRRIHYLLLTPYFCSTDLILTTINRILVCHRISSIHATFSLLTFNGLSCSPLCTSTRWTFLIFCFCIGNALAVTTQTANQLQFVIS